MTTEQKKIVGIAGALAVAAGTVGMLLGGADVTAAGGIVGLAAALLAAVLALVNGVKK